MPSLTPSLRWLFTVKFEDGNIYHQTVEDKSSILPGKSAWFDVLQDPRRPIEIQLDKINSTDHWCVDLLTGVFTCNGSIMTLSPSINILPTHGVFKPFYCRDNVVIQSIDEDGLVTSSHRHKYRLGWIYMIPGKHWEQTVIID